MLRSCSLHDRARAAECGLRAGVSQSFSSRRYAPPQHQSFVQKNRVSSFPNDLRHVWRLTVFWMEDTHAVVTEDAWSMSPPKPQQIWQKHQTGMLAKNQTGVHVCEPVIQNMSPIYIIRHMQKHTNAFAQVPKQCIA